MADAEDERLTAEWERVMDQVLKGNDPQRAFRHGIRWVLVAVFGHNERYNLDPTFYTQVRQAEQALSDLAQALGTRDPRSSEKTVVSCSACSDRGWVWTGGEPTLDQGFPEPCPICEPVPDGKTRVEWRRLKFKPGFNYKPWAMMQQEYAGTDAKALETVCIWCGKVCESLEALEAHEDECA